MADDELEWETLGRETAYTCPGFEVVHEGVRLPNGTITDYDYVSEPPAVVVLPFTDDGDVVVIDEWRQSVERVNHGLPAGTVDPRDDGPREAVHRELEEETGYVATSVDHLVSVEPANGIADSVHHHFVARGCAPEGEQDLDENESIRVDTESYESLATKVAAGGCRDGRTAIAVTYYEAFGP